MNLFPNVLYMPDRLINTPICVFFFNRPEKLNELLTTFSKYQFNKIYFVADGPRNDKDLEQLKKCYRLVDEFKNANEITKHYSDTNLGCGMRLSSGLDFFFQNEKFGFIFEDDILPRFDLTNLDSLEELALKENGITHISLFNPNSILESSEFTFYTSDKFFFIWGWATWSHVWKDYEFNFKQSLWKIWWGSLRRLYFPMNLFYFFTLTKVVKGTLNTWDLQYYISQLKNRGKSLIPVRSLIDNIGHDQEATHTISESKNFIVPRSLSSFFSMDQILTIHFIINKLKNYV